MPDLRIYRRSKVMDWLISNSFLIVVLLVCVGMHFFGHGHGHGHGKHNHDPENRYYNDPDRRA